MVNVDIYAFSVKTSNKNKRLFLVTLTLKNKDGLISYYSCQRYTEIESISIKAGSEITMYFLRKPSARYSPRFAKIEGYDLSDSLITHVPYVALGILPLVSAIYTLFN